MITRHGIEGDIHATYEVGIFDNSEKTTQLFAIAKKEYKPALLKEAIEDVKEVMSN
ncbi:unnamed protein product [marine sediment metagenome]|uniref:Uncharacterized protein n=1 Tax=marine sediment metagenome TaxID=412755 RepID=X1SM92_9ZZZZ